VAPINTVLNWQYEFEMWQEFTRKEVEVSVVKAKFQGQKDVCFIVIESEQDQYV
jgi:hypothetical protein